MNAKTQYRLLIIFALLLVIIIASNSESYSTNFANPFYDIFYLYFNNNPDKAKSLSKKQFDNPAYKTQAFINYGLMHEYEKDFKTAEEYYRKALSSGDLSALTYLYNLYNSVSNEKATALLNASADQFKQSCWIDYESAVQCFAKGDNENGYKFLSASIDKGFNSTQLLNSDPAFLNVRGSRQYKKFAQRAAENRGVSLLSELKKTEYEYYKNKPYELPKKLEIAAYFEKTGDSKKAENILLESTETDLSFKDKSITLFWLARIYAGNGKAGKAKQYLDEFISHLKSGAVDETGYKKLIAPLCNDIIANDPDLKTITQ